jgi:hypothetical protein
MDEILEQSKKTDLEIERTELNLLIQKGFKFNITIKGIKYAKGLRGFLGKREVSEETMTFEIHQPTLSTLDRMSDIALDMVVDNNKFLGENQEVLVSARQTVRENAVKLARMVAIACLGEDYHITEISESGKITRRNNDREVDRLTDLFYHSLTPSRLMELALAITNTSNLGDFIVSMRFLSGTRSAQPIKDRIE